MVSQRQVFALSDILHKGCLLFYQEKEKELKDKIRTLRNKLEEKIDNETCPIEIESFSVDTQTGSVFATIIPLTYEHTELVKTIEKLEELEEQKIKDLERIELWKDFLLIEKDNILGKPVIPKEFKKFMDKAYALLGEPDEGNI